MDIDLTWRQVLLIAFGSWAGVARAAGAAGPTGPAKWSNGVPSQCLDRIMTSAARPRWLTRDMLTYGARVRLTPNAVQPMAAE